VREEVRRRVQQGLDVADGVIGEGVHQRLGATGVGERPSANPTLLGMAA
jgi:hypothetical protein